MHNDSVKEAVLSFETKDFPVLVTLSAPWAVVPFTNTQITAADSM